MQLQEHHKN